MGFIFTGKVSLGCRNTDEVAYTAGVFFSLPWSLESRSLCRQWPSGEVSPPGLQGANHVLTLSSHGLSSVCLVLLPLLQGTSVLLDEHPTLMTSFNLDHMLESPSPNTVTLGDGASTYEIWGTQFSP